MISACRLLTLASSRIYKTRSRATRVLACVFLCAAVVPAWGDADLSDRTAKIKAAFLYKFIQYVRWPGPETETADPFVIHILGESRLEAQLRKIAEKQKVGDRDLVIRTSATVDALESCHILLLAPSAADSLQHILEQVGDRKLLTVGDTDGFGKMGVAINFILASGKVKFEINRKALAGADLWVSSRLLKLGILLD